MFARAIALMSVTAMWLDARRPHAITAVAEAAADVVHDVSSSVNNDHGLPRGFLFANPAKPHTFMMQQQQQLPVSDRKDSLRGARYAFMLKEPGNPDASYGLQDFKRVFTHSLALLGRECEETFIASDSNGDGILQPPEVKRLRKQMASLGQEREEAQAEQRAKQPLSFDTFVARYGRWLRTAATSETSSESVQKDIFAQLDVDSDGALGVKEIAQVGEYLDVDLMASVEKAMATSQHQANKENRP